MALVAAVAPAATPTTAAAAFAVGCRLIHGRRARILAAIVTIISRKFGSLFFKRTGVESFRILRTCLIPACLTRMRIRLMLLLLAARSVGSVADGALTASLVATPRGPGSASGCRLSQ